MCIAFDTGIKVQNSIDDIQFGTIKRPVVLKKVMNSWKKNPDLWQEKPISINTMQTFTSLSDKKTTFAILPKGVREYEDVGENHQTIKLTIFRTYGRLGKKDLIYRPGRASGDASVATPKAELHQNLSFDFGVYIANSCFEKAGVAEIAKKYNTPLKVYSYSEFLNGRLIFPFNRSSRDLEEKQSMVSGSGNLILSTIKKSEKRSGYIVRLYNPSFVAKGEELTFSNKITKAELVDLKEDKIDDLVIDKEKNSIKISSVKHSKVVSIYVEC